MFGSAFRGKSFGAILDQNRGIGLGFDILRIGLALLILLSHVSGIIGTSGSLSRIINFIFSLGTMPLNDIAAPALHPMDTDIKPLTGIARPFTLSHVPMFFALSGFLVAGSALRTRNLLRFLGLRVLRLLPALVVEVVLSAIILGGIFTTLSLEDYYTSRGFFMYFLNIIGEVQMHLPGVFEHTSHRLAVNANLWTLPFELYSYIIMSGLMLSTLILRRILFTAIMAVATVVLIIANYFYGYQVVTGTLNGEILVYYFLVGVIFFLWRDKIIYHEAIFVACLILSYVLMMSSRTVFIYPALLTYVTIFIGLFPFRQFKILKSGDYSYGVYLYGYPVTQALVAAFPALKSSLLLTCICSVTVTCIFAAFSWHMVEKKVLKLKRHLSPKSFHITETLHPDATEGAVQKAGGQSAEGLVT